MRVPAAAPRAPQPLRPRSGGGVRVCANGGGGVQMGSCKWGVCKRGGVQMGEEHLGKYGGGGSRNGGRPCTGFCEGGWVCKQGVQACKACKAEGAFVPIGRLHGGGRAKCYPWGGLRDAVRVHDGCARGARSSARCRCEALARGACREGWHACKSSARGARCWCEAFARRVCKQRLLVQGGVAAAGVQKVVARALHVRAVVQGSRTGPCAPP